MTAEVILWGTRVAAVSQAEGEPFARFQYDPDFLASGMEISPVTMPLREAPYAFPDLARSSFRGLPGLLADALPDRFGNRLIDAWLAREGRAPESFSPLERLCWMGTRGMGALEFRPVRGPRFTASEAVSVERLVELANEILSERSAVATSLREDEAEAGLREILRVGTSAGGARAKAVIAWNAETGEVRSGQVAAGPEFEYWLLKFDGVSGNRDKELADPQGFGAVEYAYFLMARAAGIEMSECRLLEENGRRHFMTRRFDRTAGGAKLHMQSLGGLCHYDFNEAGAVGYEQALLCMRRLGVKRAAFEEQFRRAVFNVLARNQDDHVRNIAFLMNRRGEWRLSPAYDVTYAFNPDGARTSRHQMTINGRAEGFTREDLLALGKVAEVRTRRAREVIDQVAEAVARWDEFAAEAQVPEALSRPIGRAHRRLVS